MSQPADVSVVELEQIVSALVGLARDRGATSAQQATLGRIWAEAQAVALSGLAAPALHGRAATLAADLLGVDALLAPENAPYGGFWQEVELPAERPETDPARAVPLDDRRAELRAFLAGNRSPTWAELAARGLTGSLPFAEACGTIEELARVVAGGPYLQTITLLPALAADERERIASGEVSWAVATGPLVLDLDTATSVAMIGGDGIFELVGAERELLASRDATRPLGVVAGGDAGRRLGDSTSLRLLRRRLLTGLAFEALGVIDAVGSGPSAIGARALADEAARLVETDDPTAEAFATAAKAVAGELAIACSADALASADADARPELERLRERARFVRAWEAAPAQLFTELGKELIEAGAEE